MWRIQGLERSIREYLTLRVAVIPNNRTCVIDCDCTRTAHETREVDGGKGAVVAEEPVGLKVSYNVGADDIAEVVDAARVG